VLASAPQLRRRGLRLAEILIENRVEEGHPSRLGIEDMVRETLRDFMGTWHVLIRPAQTPPWWIVLLERQGGDAFTRTLLLNPSTAGEAVGKALLEALKGAV
jgi:hypothetical protein